MTLTLTTPPITPGPEQAPVEKWRPVVEFPDHYEVSSVGRVRRIAPSVGSQSYPGRPIATCRWGDRHHAVLHINGGQINRSVSRLVAAAFFGPCPKDHVVVFRNGDHDDPRAENLQYKSTSQIHSELGLAQRKLTPGQVDEIRRNPNGLSLRALGRRYGIAFQTISRIQQGLAYRGA